MIEHPTADLGAYALGVLEPDEDRAIAAHLAVCPPCRAETASLAETVWRVSETAGREAPAHLRRAILDRARRDGAAAAPAVRASWWSALLRPVPLLVPAALVAVLLIALVGYGSARRDADRYAVAISAAAGARVVPLAVTPAGPPGMRGSLVVPANGATPYLILDLPAAPAGKTWEAWVIHGGTPVRAGQSDDRGVTILDLAAPLGPGDTVAITPEPAGGVDRPTGAPVLAGTS